MHSPRSGLWTVFFLALVSSVAHAQEKPILGLIPKATKPLKMDATGPIFKPSFAENRRTEVPSTTAASPFR